MTAAGAPEPTNVDLVAALRAADLSPSWENRRTVSETVWIWVDPDPRDGTTRAVAMGVNDDGTVGYGGYYLDGPNTAPGFCHFSNTASSIAKAVTAMGDLHWPDRGPYP